MEVKLRVIKYRFTFPSPRSPRQRLDGNNKRRVLLILREPNLQRTSKSKTAQGAEESWPVRLRAEVPKAKVPKVGV